MKIFEILDNPVDWEYTTQSDTQVIAEFTIDDHEYGIFISDYSKQQKFYSISFTINNTSNQFGITGTGNQFVVFATTKSIIEDFASKNNPEGFTFTAQEPSRVKLYRKFMVMFKKTEFNKVNILSDGETHHFIVAKSQDKLDEMSKWLSKRYFLS